MKNKMHILGIGLLTVLIGGCAQPTIKPPEPITDQYMVKAQEYEAKGDLVEALEQYKLALTVDPENQAAKEKRAKIGQELRELAENHYQTGLNYHRKGQYDQARKEFLTALRYTPDHQEAKKMLREQVIGEQQVKGYVLHTIQPNESISMLAKKYYGDPKKFQIIAEYNQLEDATKVRVGQKIKIPEIEGVSFAKKPAEKSVQTAMKPVTSAVVEGPREEEKEEEKKEVEEIGKEKQKEEEEKELAAVDQSANYRELGIEFFNEKAYDAAISEFKKVLNINPTDKKALEYISASHFQQGLIVFGNEDYLAARDEFKASFEYNEDCEKCSEYIKKCEEAYMDVHYNKGIMYFRDEKLEKAIQEWGLVSEIDPEYKDVDDNLKKSRKLLERLEKIKRSKMKE
jgi:tetratricopeptide (TPR) repeat protein